MVWRGRGAFMGRSTGRGGGGSGDLGARQVEECGGRAPQGWGVASFGRGGKSCGATVRVQRWDPQGR
eukprot:10441354-Lingulodinium_polyedra.AAC.1